VLLYPQYKITYLSFTNHFSREIARQLLEENQLMALQQKEKEKYYRDVVNNNTPTDEYYAQFNTTTR
jgi:hypothetical protein